MIPGFQGLGSRVSFGLGRLWSLGSRVQGSV